MNRVVRLEGGYQRFTPDYVLWLGPYPRRESRGSNCSTRVKSRLGVSFRKKTCDGNESESQARNVHGRNRRDHVELVVDTVLNLNIPLDHSSVHSTNHTRE